MLALHHEAISFLGLWLPGSHRIWPSLSAMFLVVLIVVADETSAAPDVVVVGFFSASFQWAVVSAGGGSVRGSGH